MSGLPAKSHATTIDLSAQGVPGPTIDEGTTWIYLSLLADDRHSILQLHIIKKALQKHVGNTN